MGTPEHESKLLSPPPNGCAGSFFPPFCASFSSAFGFDSREGDKGKADVLLTSTLSKIFDYIFGICLALTSRREDATK